MADLLKSIVTKCPSVCDINHFAAILGAYGATLGTTGNVLMLLLIPEWVNRGIKQVWFSVNVFIVLGNKSTCYCNGRLTTNNNLF